MPFSSLPSSRPFVTIGLSTLLACSLALTGCSSPPPEAKKPVVVPTTGAVVTPTRAPAPAPVAFTAKGMPADLAAVIKPVYFGGAFAASPAAGVALRKRKAVKAAGPVVVSGALASWQGVPIAVVTKGNDVTLAVKAPKWRVVGGWWPSLGLTAASLGGGPRRVLVIGSDARPGEAVDRARADSLHIVGFDGRGGGGVLGIPRDSYVPMATGGQNKINAALVFGGPVGMQRTVASLSGVALEGYLLTGFEGFKKLIDGIGGLPVNVPVAVRGAGADVFVKAGASTLTGREALAYGRSRKTVAGGDFGRSLNQGRLIVAAASFAKLVGPAKLPHILQMAGPRMGTNMSAEQILTFAASVYVTSPRKVRNKVALGSGGMAGGQSIVRLDGGASRLFADMRDGNLS
jgi:polyisoprenyl-teichoic acid--peptidoglycan teichoic acid transferase